MSTRGTGLQAPMPQINKVLWYGACPVATPVNVTEITNIAKFIPGRLATRGSQLGSGAGYTDYDAYVAMNAIDYKVAGWIGYDDVDTNAKPANRLAAYESSNETRLYKGQGFGIVARLYKYMTVKADDLVCNWFDGMVAGPCLPADGGVFLGIPFTGGASSEINTHVVIPLGMIIGPRSFVQVTTGGAVTIDVGTLNAAEGGNADGLMDGVSVASALILGPDNFYASSNGETIGDLLNDGEIVGTSTYTKIVKIPGYRVPAATGNAVGSTISYTLSGTTACAGIIWLHLISPNLRIVGQAAESLATTTVEDDLRVTSLI